MRLNEIDRITCNPTTSNKQPATSNKQPTTNNQNQNMKRIFEIYILAFLLLFVATGAIYGGGSLILAPDGSMLKIDPNRLEMLPFTNFLIPGIILFLLLGIFPLVAIFGLFLRKDNRILNTFNIFSDKYWGWTFTLYTGIICVIWIVVQQLLTGYFILQPIIAGTGILIVIFCLVPRVQKFFTIETK
jgi:magnesium-transporting ATPase (P-type)